jgi:hypothetical protein
LADVACPRVVHRLQRVPGNVAVLNAHQSVFILICGFFAEMSLARADAALVDSVFGN